MAYKKKLREDDGKGLIPFFTWLMGSSKDKEPDCSQRCTVITQEATYTNWNEEYLDGENFSS